MKIDENYQSILNHLNTIPIIYLGQINDYLTNFKKKISKKEQNRTLILELAGSWNDMTENDFESFLLATKEVSKNMFNKEIEL